MRFIAIVKFESKRTAIIYIEFQFILFMHLKVLAGSAAINFKYDSAWCFDKRPT